MTTTFSRKVRAAALALAIGATGTLTAVESAGAQTVAPLQSCVTGRLVHTYNLVKEPVPGWSITPFDADTGQANEKLTDSAVTDANGRFRFCFTSIDVDRISTAFGSYPVTSLQDVYVWANPHNLSTRTFVFNGEYYSTATEFGVRPVTNLTWDYQSPVRKEIPSGVTTDLGDLSISANPLGQISADLAAVEAWLPKSSAGCRDRRDTTCPTRFVYRIGNEIVIVPDTRRPSEFVSGSLTDRASSIDAISRSVLVDVYEGPGPFGRPAECPAGQYHCWRSAINDAGYGNYAFGFGTAQWMTASILKTNRIKGYDLESVDATTAGWATGNSVEGRVAAGLIDISDARNEGGDKLAEGDRVPGKIWTTITDRLPLTFSDFVAKRAAGGFDTGANFDSTLAHNTLTR